MKLFEPKLMLLTYATDAVRMPVGRMLKIDDHSIKVT